MDDAARVGEVIAERWKIAGVLGKGGWRPRFASRDLKGGGQVALKELALKGLGDWKVLELFEREAKVLASLEHPVVPRYVAYLQADTSRGKCFCLVQEIAPGRSLAQWIADGWRPDEAEVKRIADQVLIVPGHLHGSNPPVVHRDLKPQNLIRDEDGTIRLVDFRAVQDAYRHTVTGGSTVVGTYGYIAPEQFRGQASPASDLYALGATLLFLLTRRTTSDFAQKKMRLQFREHVSASPGFVRWLERMLEPDAADRYLSAAAARRMLASGEPARASARRLPYMIGALVLVAGAAGAIVVRTSGERGGGGPAKRGVGAAATSVDEPPVAQIQWRHSMAAHFSAVFSVDVSPDGLHVASDSSTTTSGKRAIASASASCGSTSPRKSGSPKARRRSTAARSRRTRCPRSSRTRCRRAGG
jgi:hypothetical protein